jgi:hypothetical protein
MCHNGIQMSVSVPFHNFLLEIQRQRKKIDKYKLKSKASFTDLTDLMLKIVVASPSFVDKLLTSKIK